MREYGQVQSAFWQSKDAEAFSDGAKLLAVYLLTCPHANGLGCYRLPDGYVSGDLGWDSETVSKRFRELDSVGFAHRCAETKWLLIPNFLKWNPVSNPKIAAARVKEARDVPQISEIWGGMVEAIHRYGKHFPADFVDLLQQKWLPIASHVPDATRASLLVPGAKCARCGATDDLTLDHIRPISYGGSHAIDNLQVLCRSCNSIRYPKGFDTVSAFSENHIETEPNPTQPNPTQSQPRKNPKTLGHRPDDRDWFESKFWPTYPRKVAKASAAKAFSKINPDDALLGRMLAALAVHVASEQWRRDDGRFIPHPATWLNQRRWEDEAESAAAFDPASCADGAVL